MSGFYSAEKKIYNGTKCFGESCGGTGSERGGAAGDAVAVVASCLHSHGVVLPTGEFSRQHTLTGVVAAHVAEAAGRCHQVVLHVGRLVPGDLHL